MADEIVIRIEGDDDDNEIDRLAELEREARAVDDPAFQPQITMESLFGSDPWWLDPEFINNTVGTQERISYPTASPQKVESGENADDGNYIYVPFFERAITLLEGIRGSQLSRDPGIPKDDGPIGINQNLINQLGNQIGNAVNAINAVQALNNPVAAGAGALQTFGNTAGNITNAAITAGLGTALTPVLGPLAPVIAGIIGDVAGGAVKLFFSTIAEGIQSFFDYANRQANELAPFSPEIISAQVGRQLSMLDFRINAGQNFGQQFADMYAAQTELTLALEKLKLDLFTRFSGAGENITILLADLIQRIDASIQVVPAVAREYLGPLLPLLVAANPMLGTALAALEGIEAHVAKIKADMKKREDENMNNVQLQTLKFFGWQP